jgi:anti-sigma factor RsiW
MSPRRVACLWYRSSLDAHVDGALGPRTARRLDRHLARCPDCRRRVDETAALIARVRAAAAGPVPEPDWTAFWPGIRARLSRPARPVRDPWWLPVWKPIWGHPRLSGALATACLVLALGLGFWPGQEVEGLGQVVVQDVATGRPDSAVMVYAGRHEPVTVIWLFTQDTD